MDLSKVSVVELSSRPVAGEINPPEKLYLYIGDGDNPLTVAEPEDVKTLLEALGLEKMGDG